MADSILNAIAPVMAQWEADARKAAQPFIRPLQSLRAAQLDFQEKQGYHEDKNSDLPNFDALGVLSLNGALSPKERYYQGLSRNDRFNADQLVTLLEAQKKPLLDAVNTRIEAHLEEVTGRGADISIVDEATIKSAIADKILYDALRPEEVRKYYAPGAAKMPSFVSLETLENKMRTDAGSAIRDLRAAVGTSNNYYQQLLAEHFPAYKAEKLVQLEENAKIYGYPEGYVTQERARINKLKPEDVRPYADVYNPLDGKYAVTGIDSGQEAQRRAELINTIKGKEDVLRQALQASLVTQEAEYNVNLKNTLNMPADYNRNESRAEQEIEFIVQNAEYQGGLPQTPAVKKDPAPKGPVKK